MTADQAADTVAEAFSRFRVNIIAWHSHWHIHERLNVEDCPHESCAKDVNLLAEARASLAVLADDNKRKTEAFSAARNLEAAVELWQEAYERFMGVDYDRNTDDALLNAEERLLAALANTRVPFDAALAAVPGEETK